MYLNDGNLNHYIDKVLKLPSEKRKQYLAQVDYLIAEMRKKIDDDSIFDVRRFIKCGSLMKGTALKPRDGDAVDADVVVELDVSEATAQDIDQLHSILLSLLINIYHQKTPDDFTIQPRTLGVVFRVSGLNLDLVPVVPVPGKPGFSWQHSSRGEPPVITNVEGQLAFIRTRASADVRYKRLVRLLKRWRNHQGLDALRSFAIELLLAYVQDHEGPANSLEEGVLRFFLYVAQSQLGELVSFPETGRPSSMPEDPVVIIDPVNVDNNVARRITLAERTEIAQHAKAAWETLQAATFSGGKGETLDLWKEQFGVSFHIED